MRASILIAGMLASGLAHGVTIDFQILGNTVSYLAQGDRLQLIHATVQVDSATGAQIPGTIAMSVEAVTRAWSVSGTFDLTPIYSVSTPVILRQYTLLSYSTTGLFDGLGGTPPQLLPVSTEVFADRMTAGGVYLLGHEMTSMTAACNGGASMSAAGCEAGQFSVVFESTRTFDPNASPDLVIPYLNKIDFAGGTSWVTPLDATTLTHHIDVVGILDAPEPGSMGVCAATLLGLAAWRRRGRARGRAA